MSGFLDFLLGSKNNKPNTTASKGKGTKKQSNKAKSKNNRKQKNGNKVSKTIQDNIPYTYCYENGIIETDPGHFTKSYLLRDINFRSAATEEQQQIFIAWNDFLNTFGSELQFQVTIFNRDVNKQNFVRDVLIPAKGDAFDGYREEMNHMLREKLEEGHNNIVCEKYLTISTEAENIDAATRLFQRIDSETSRALKRIVSEETSAMTTAERLDILYNIMNCGTNIAFTSKMDMKDTFTGEVHEVSFFDFKHMQQMGLTTKDVIGPEDLKFEGSKIQLGKKVARVMFLRNMPSFLSADIVTEIAEVSCNMVFSMYFEPLRQDKSIQTIRHQMTNINANVSDQQKKASKEGFSVDLISPDLLQAQEEAMALLKDLTQRNQKMFMVTITIMILADDEDALDKYTEEIKNAAARRLCQFNTLSGQQELGFKSVMPLCVNKLLVSRLLTTESAAVFIPFSAQEIVQPGGFYYGLNAISKNMILFNRNNSKNTNGCILGTPGSGKSFSAKREMVNVILNTDDDIFIIDPEQEYTPLAQEFNGEVIRIAPGSRQCVNPLDMDMKYADSDDPISLKANFMQGLCETIIGGRLGLSPVQKSIIDRCITLIYQPYIEHMQRHPEINRDPDAAPTLVEFYYSLLEQPEPEAQNIATSIEMYAIGNLNTFAHKTNVDINNRFIVYNIKDLGPGMKEMGQQICLDNAWNRVIDNFRRGKRTWVYIDEFYLLTQTESSATYLNEIFKRCRKWAGTMTGITQNVTDLLASKEARNIMSNCDFIMMLNQAPIDKADLAKLYSLSPTQLDYITNSPAGQGLLYTGATVVPFVDQFPQDTQLYKAMSTKPDEKKQKEQESTDKETPNVA